MSVNRFAMTSPALCATPGVLTSPAALAGFPGTVFVDIEANWTATEAWAEARAILIDRAARNPQTTTLLRIGMPHDDMGQDAVGRLAALHPDGFVLSGCRGGADIQMLDVMLRVAEAEHGLKAGSIAILAEVGDNPGFFLSSTSLLGISERLKGILFDGDALACATASRAFNLSANRVGAPLLFARATAVLKAAQAGLPCHEVIAQADVSEADLRTWRNVSLADGFAGAVVRTVPQLATLAAS
jgi:citrate lyase subunit beta/citryl-CoA lyase